VKQHQAYRAAKAGDGFAATELVNDTMSEEQNVRLVALMKGHTPILVSAHAYEREGVNAIPESFAVEISKATGWPHDVGVAQVNVVAHTGADGFSPSLTGWFRLAVSTCWLMTLLAWVALWPI